ncbi:MAG: methionine synthase [Anaerolineae bacterium]|nr:methionine synthase [Anaerolineae bacterium]
MVNLIPAWQPIAIGSVPYTDPERAWSAVLRYFPQTPFWPQLPQRSYKENMYAQYSERFPGVVLEDQRIYVDRRQDLDPGLERLYLAYLADDLSYGAVGPEFSAALAALQDGQVTFAQAPQLLKGQVTGPVSWGLTVVDQNRRPLLYDEILADAVAKHLRLKAGWQQALLSGHAANTLIFVDEPYLCAYGSAFVSLSREQVVRYLHEVLAEITGLKGVHCCGNTDWSILLETPIDVLSLDAYDYASSLALYPEQVGRFLQRGGVIAWGIVPNTQAAEAETAESLAERLEQAIDSLAEKGVSRDMLLGAGLVSPACGTGSLPTALAERVFDLTAQVSALMRERYATGEVERS